MNEVLHFVVWFSLFMSWGSQWDKNTGIYNELSSLPTDAHALDKGRWCECFQIHVVKCLYSLLWIETISGYSDICV